VSGCEAVSGCAPGRSSVSGLMTEVSVTHIVRSSFVASFVRRSFVVFVRSFVVRSSCSFVRSFVRSFVCLLLVGWLVGWLVGCIVGWLVRSLQFRWLCCCFWTVRSESSDIPSACAGNCLFGIWLVGRFVHTLVVQSHCLVCLSGAQHVLAESYSLRNVPCLSKRIPLRMHVSL